MMHLFAERTWIDNRPPPFELDRFAHLLPVVSVDPPRYVQRMNNSPHSAERDNMDADNVPADEGTAVPVVVMQYFVGGFDHASAGAALAGP
jgi:hypothetical protein